MSINKKLNEQYFETKRKHKEGREKIKLTFKQKIIRLIVTAIFIYIFSYFYKSCQNKIEESKRRDLLQQTALYQIGVNQCWIDRKM